jgi:hypothetical protein
VCGRLLSAHRTASAARRAAERECRRAGLADDGAYSGDDGWPAIVDTAGGERVDYQAPEVSS